MAGKTGWDGALMALEEETAALAKRAREMNRNGREFYPDNPQLMYDELQQIQEMINRVQYAYVLADHNNEAR